MQFNQILSRSRELVRARSVQPSDALAIAVDEAIEGSETSLSEADVLLRASQLLEGFGPLQALIDDESIEEIWINRPNEIFFYDADGKHCLEIEFGEREIRSVVQRMLRHSKRKIDRLTPYVDADLEDGSRLHVVIPEVTRNHWSLNIRKFKSSPLGLEDLLVQGAITDAQFELLLDAARTGSSVLVCGATQAGKTTLLSALLGELNDAERIVSCEDTFEISLNHPDWVAMQTRPSGIEGQSDIGLRELVRQALRMRPSRLVIGEVRGAEALDMLVALNSGIPGMGTIHAPSAIGALEKLKLLPLLAGENITERFLVPTIKSAIDLVVHCHRDQSGRRRVTEILEVTNDLVF